MGQKKRATKVSKGVHGGGGKTSLSMLQKVLIHESYTDRLGAARKRRAAEK